MRFLLALVLLLSTCNKTPKACPEYRKMIDTSVETFKQDIQECPVVVVYVGADWCPPCQGMKPYLAKAVDEFAGSAKFLHIDVTKDSDISDTLGVGNEFIPFFRLYVNDEITWEGNESSPENLDRRIRGALISSGFKR